MQLIPATWKVLAIVRFYRVKTRLVSPTHSEWSRGGRTESGPEPASAHSTVLPETVLSETVLPATVLSGTGRFPNQAVRNEVRLAVRSNAPS